MAGTGTQPPRRYRAFTGANLHMLAPLEGLSQEQRLAIRTVATVLPFRVNRYVVDELIDWNDIPHDPIFQLTFPQEGMLDPAAFRKIRDLLHRGAPKDEVRAAARRVQYELNPHPSGQMEHNVPQLDGQAVRGMQHKYRETVLFFPSSGQTCHAYCTYCFRWAQFVGLDDMKFAAREVQGLIRYLKLHPDVTDVLFTGGDPLVMKTRLLRRYVEPLLKLPQIRSIRIGSKAPAYWPHRFVEGCDADDLLRLFGEVRKSGRHLALMAHFSHPRELSTPVAQHALRRVVDSGAVVRCQAPVIRHVNDDPEVWSEMWREEVRLGAVPYYMFVERDTGPKSYFELPLARTLQIFQHAYRQVSGLARTVRGPSMSATPGKVLVEGTAEVQGRKLFALKFIQGRDPRWVDQIFFAEYDASATWLSDLRPALGEKEFFFERKIHRLRGEATETAARGLRRPRAGGSDPEAFADLAS